MVIADDNGLLEVDAVEQARADGRPLYTVTFSEDVIIADTDNQVDERVRAPRSDWVEGARGRALNPEQSSDSLDPSLDTRDDSRGSRNLAHGGQTFTQWATACLGALGIDGPEAPPTITPVDVPAAYPPTHPPGAPSSPPTGWTWQTWRTPPELRQEWRDVA